MKGGSVATKQTSAWRSAVAGHPAPVAVLVALVASLGWAAVPVRVVDTQVDPVRCQVDLFYDVARDQTVVAYPHVLTATFRVARVASCQEIEYRALYEQGVTGLDVSLARDSLGLLSAVHRSLGDPLGPLGLRYTLDGGPMFGLSTIAIDGTTKGRAPVFALDGHDRPYVAFCRMDGQPSLATFDVRRGRWVVAPVPGPRMAAPEARFLSLALDHQDRPVVAWYDENSSVSVATLGSGGWSSRSCRMEADPPIDSSGLCVAVDSVDVPWVAFSTVQGLLVLRFNVLNVVTQVAAPGVQALLSPHAMVVDPANRIRIGFYNQVDRSVYVAANDFGWSSTLVESNVSAHSVSIALGSLNRWIVAYCEVDHQQIRLAGLGLWGTVQADFDCDGRVSTTDRDHFEACATGPSIPQFDANCLNADFDRDCDVDQDDFAVFQRCWSGGDSADVHCAD